MFPSDLSEIKSLLEQVATDSVVEKGFIPEFSKESLLEISSPAEASNIKDMSHLFWISIDNVESQDLDQITYVEKCKNSSYRLYVAIADVDHHIPFESEVDLVARNNTTTIYTPFKIFPMLPAEFCYDKTSLLPHKQRNAIITQIAIHDDGSFKLEEVYQAKVENKAKLNYPSVTEFLDHGTDISNLKETKKNVYDQLLLHDEIGKKIHAYRHRKGALIFSPMQGEAIFERGIPVGIQQKKQTTGHKVIENLMIAANVCMTHFFINAKLPIIRRVVKTPKRWGRIVEIANKHNFKISKKPDTKSLQEFLIHEKKKDPLHFPDLSLTIIKLIGRGEYVLSQPGEKAIGHFDLALIDYAHTTAPNRRYPDLMMQRLLKNELNNKGVNFQVAILHEIANNCSEKEEAASKIERHLFKSFAAFILSKKIGENFQAIVTGVSESGTWIRLNEIPVEGKLIKGFEDVDVGDYITVHLCSVDIPRGFIDFCKK